MDNYTISGTNTMTTTSQINETTLTLPYNVRQTIEIAATNCIGTSGTAMFTYFEGEVNYMLCIVASFPGLPRLSSLVCVQYNTWKWNTECKPKN